MAVCRANSPTATSSTPVGLRRVAQVQTLARVRRESVDLDGHCRHVQTNKSLCAGRNLQVDRLRLPLVPGWPLSARSWTLTSVIPSNRPWPPCSVCYAGTTDVIRAFLALFPAPHYPANATALPHSFPFQGSKVPSDMPFTFPTPHTHPSAFCSPTRQAHVHQHTLSQVVTQQRHTRVDQFLAPSACDRVSEPAVGAVSRPPARTSICTSPSVFSPTSIPGLCVPRHFYCQPVMRPILPRHHHSSSSLALLSQLHCSKILTLVAPVDTPLQHGS